MLTRIALVAALLATPAFAQVPDFEGMDPTPENCARATVMLATASAIGEGYLRVYENPAETVENRHVAGEAMVKIAPILEGLSGYLESECPSGE